MARERKQEFRKDKPEKKEFRKKAFSKEGSYPERKNKEISSEGAESNPERKQDFHTDKPEKPQYRKKPYTKPGSRPGRERNESKTGKTDSNLIRLNKYIADAGICSRREADKLISAGVVTVNGNIVTELGTKVSPEDKVTFGDQKLSREKPRYVLLNKPKGFVTSVDDPHHEKTVMHLIANACKERIYPVGRLDRNTTGLLLFTNDGQIAKKLTHPRYGVKKIYHVGLDKPLSKTDKAEIMNGIELEDGLIKVDAIEYVEEGSNRKEIGIELHSGKNRIVRRIFEKLGYKVVKLDRVYYAGLTKKNLPRGTWRLLEEKEINLLKMLS
ncbi:MAG: pseudouridine synthase [Bacteroidetes bacterium]|nr:pseudouridine synthase [Bacteroidota bacterium]